MVLNAKPDCTVLSYPPSPLDEELWALVARRKHEEIQAA